MTIGFILSMLLVSVIFWLGLACAFFAAQYPRERAVLLRVAVGLWAVALSSLIACGAV